MRTPSMPPSVDARRIVIAVSAISFLIALPAPAQQKNLMKAEDVLAKWTEKTGGEAWKKLRNRVMYGTIEIRLLHVKGPVTSYSASPGSRLDVWEFVPGQAFERGCDGSVAWELAPESKTQVMVGSARATAILDATFDMELRWQELYSKVETVAIRQVTHLAVGNEPETKRPCYEVRMTPKNPECQPELWYIDTENFQRIGAISKIMSPTGLINRQRLFADYRMVNDVLVPFVVCEQVDIQKQVIEYKSIQHNVRMSKSRFDLPEAVKKQLAESAKTATTSAPTTQPAAAADNAKPRADQPDTVSR